MREVTLNLAQGCGIKGCIPSSGIQGNLPLYMGLSVWEALSVVSQKWSFPTALILLVLTAIRQNASLHRRFFSFFF